MTNDISKHAWFAERLGAYLTDGLSAAERAEFESHAKECGECAGRLAEAKLEDETLRGLFAQIEPSAGFEDRVIRRLRTAAEPRKFALPRGIRLDRIRLHPKVLRAAGAVAAIVVLGGLGLTAMQMSQRSTRLVPVAMNLDQLVATRTQMPLLSPDANPYFNLDPGYKMAPGLQPTFAVGADIKAGLQNFNGSMKDTDGDGIADVTAGNRERNPIESELTKAREHGDLFSLGTNPAPRITDANTTVPAAKPATGLLNQGTPADQPVSLNYSYRDTITAPSASEPEFYKPTSTAVPGNEPKPAEQTYAQTREEANRELALLMQDQERKAGSALVDKLTARNVQPTDPATGNTETGKAVPENESTPPTPTIPAPATNPSASRKVIRHGEMSFEVDSFDSAFMQISKIATEEGGFISDTNSEKLANGKMSGTITVRMPPEHLDTLALKLRALGDLKGQKITADDITKQYTDLQSELRAATAMEDRLLEIIQKGNGQVKDLLAAEKEAGVWREKIEQVTGEINYYNNLISLSTLQITLTEKDIRQAALASERETVDMGIETDDVEKARAEAMRTLDGAKARIIQADLKKLDAGQLAATITAQVSPEAAGPVIDHFRQLGRVARLNINRQQTVADGATVPAGIKVDRLDTQLVISLYNLANVSPRQTTNVSLACPDVEIAYHAIISAVTDGGGRVVDSSLNRVKPEQTDGVISFESPRDKAEMVLAKVRALGEVMHLTVTENPDAANVTDAKQGFALTLASTATIAPRETIVSTVMPGGKMADAYRAVRDIVQEDHGNISVAQLQEQISQSDTATLVFDVSREHQADVENAITKAIGEKGRIIARQNSRSNDTEHTLDSKVQFNLTFTSNEALQPRETITRLLAVSDVSTVYSQILAAAQQAGAKVAGASLDQSTPSSPVGQLDLIILRDQANQVEKVIAGANGGIISKSVSRSADLNSTTDEKVELRLTLGDLSQLPPRQTTTMNMEVSDPESALNDLQAAVLASGGRILEQNLVKDDKYQGHLVVGLPLAKGPEFIDRTRDSGTVQTITRTENLSVPASDFAEAKLDITLNASGSVVGPNAGLWTGLRSGLGASIRGLAYSLELVVIGVCLVLPWVAMGWLGWKLFKRFRRKTAVA